MKTLHLNHSDISGGAARAAYRLHHCLRDAGIDSRMGVDRAVSGDWTVEPPERKLQKLAVMFRSSIGGQLTRLLKTNNPIIHSPAILPSRWPKQLNRSDTDIVHLHWAAGEMLSVADIARIRKPRVWTLHDMWAFCGAEHYTEDNRWRVGYQRNNRPHHEAGFDLNRWTWHRKRKHWRTPLQIVTPSRWLADCVRASVLMHDWPVTVIPNPLDTQRWRPLAQSLARELLGLPDAEPIVLFGAMGGSRDPRKGFDLLQAALAHCRDQSDPLRLLVFGQLAPRHPPDLGFPIHYTGHLHDDLSLQVLYSAADMLLIPSRQDNLPNTGVEAQACGCPVVAFDCTGLPDVVEHGVTGYLARPYEPEDLAAGFRWVLDDPERHARLSAAARERAVRLWSPEVVVPQYLEVYRAAIEHWKAG